MCVGRFTLTELSGLATAYADMLLEGVSTGWVGFFAVLLFNCFFHSKLSCETIPMEE